MMKSLSRTQLVVIGVSSGGVETLQEFFSLVSGNFQTPVAIVHHLPSNFRSDLGLLYRRFTERTLVEAEDKMEIRPGHVYFAPPSYHLLVEKDFSFSLSVDEAQNFARPSIDVLFQSAADALGASVCGVLLTGSNSDGAEGLFSIQRAGGLTIVQSPATAQYGYMPESALKLFKPDFVSEISEIAHFFNSIMAVENEAKV